MSERPRWIGDLITVAGIATLFGVVYLLPPDTSLAQIKQAGILRICVPTLYPPLVTGKPDLPGFDIDFAQAIARRLEVRLVVNTNPAMGRDFNPRNWNLTRAQCQMLAGGVVVSDLTRSFLDTTPPHLQTGWALVAANVPGGLQDAKVGFYAGLVGLDRIALSRFLQGQKARIEIVASAEALGEGLRSGRFDAGVSEALMARQIAGTLGSQVAWLPESLGRFPVAFGLWKGDLTLKRRLVEVIDDLDREGLVRELTRRYQIAPIVATLGGELTR
jgi:polar amino acid transport system substrate-binding protein/cystine transport system substrate-binding protein/membrane-bound lytic murein transglycosylase F